MTGSPPKRSPLIILLLILSGEAIFVLPFVLARIFRPTFLEAFGINNFELGICFSVYGIVALFSYLFGGSLADKYAPQNLMAMSLLLTAIGGVYMATFPSSIQLQILFGYFGFTTIFLFWAPMIKTTRIWGGSHNQGMAYGFLDGGRGLVAACFGSIGIWVFSSMLNIDIQETTAFERQQAFRYTILVSSAVIAVIGMFVYFFLKPISSLQNVVDKKKTVYTIENFRTVMAHTSVWLMMIIIMCAYLGYKVTDIFSLYAKDVLNYNDIRSAEIGTYLLYIRPITGITIGFLADRTKASFWILIGFAVMFISSLLFVSGIISENTIFLFFTSIIFMSIGVYATRVLYFALMEEANLPLTITGTAIGFISVVGYTPDIFAGPMIGILLDNSPGELGHQHVFMMTTVFTVIGLIAAFVFYKRKYPIKKSNL